MRTRPGALRQVLEIGARDRPVCQAPHSAARTCSMSSSRHCWRDLQAAAEMFGAGGRAPRARRRRGSSAPRLPPVTSRRKMPSSVEWREGLVAQRLHLLAHRIADEMDLVRRLAGRAVLSSHRTLAMASTRLAISRFTPPSTAFCSWIRSGSGRASPRAGREGADSRRSRSPPTGRNVS